MAARPQEELPGLEGSSEVILSLSFASRQDGPSPSQPAHGALLLRLSSP